MSAVTSASSLVHPKNASLQDPVPGGLQVAREPAETSVTAPAGAGPAEGGTSFADLGLRPELLRALVALGYEEPTPIQAEAVPVLLTGRDLVGQAATGTGKTAAFTLPLLQRIGGSRPTADPGGLVLVPTRELALQVTEAVTQYGAELGTRVVAVYGGQPVGVQLRSLRGGADVVVATPGRAVDLIGKGALRLGAVEVVVLDEADEMLDMGFAEDIEAVLGATPGDRQTVLFSATLPPRTARIAAAHLHDPVRVQVEREAVAPGEAPAVRQVAHLVRRGQKVAALARVLDVEAPVATLVFCRTRGDVDTVAEALAVRGHRTEALHGGMAQEARDRVMGRLRSGAADLIVATDVAARGLDVDHLTHVVNYEVPSAPETYVHRIGRVGRVGRTGTAVTLVDPRERRLLDTVERVVRTRVELLPLPTVADLRRARLGRLRTAVLGVLDDGPGDVARYRGLVDELAADRDLAEVAAAALAVAAAAREPAAVDEEIEPVTARPERTASRADRGDRGDRADRGDRPSSRPGSGPRREVGARTGAAPGTARLWIGLGRKAGVRPGDLVGAIANESPVPGKRVNVVQIAERFSVVEVPAGDADDVIGALRASTVKGRKAQVRRDRDG